MNFLITSGRILNDKNKPKIKNPIAMFFVDNENNSCNIQKVFPLNQHHITTFSILLRPDVYPINTIEIMIVGIAKIKLTQPNPKNHAKSLIIQSGKCKDSKSVLSLNIRLHLIS